MTIKSDVESTFSIEDGGHAPAFLGFKQCKQDAELGLGKSLPTERAAPHPSYLTHLDGLRALALGGVLMFHFGTDGFGSGGFIGVDMFFLLSGFLVTRNILDDVVKGIFSLPAFYRKRFWRLYPSSLCTTLCVLVAALCLYSGSLLEQALRSVMASMVSVSNVLFYFEAGYWDSGAELKPLLHTWSLSVEEQFYLLWPGLLLLLARMLGNGRRVAWGATFGLLAAVSFVLTWYWEQNDPSGAFFLLPSRVYQFSVGAALLGLSEHFQEHEGVAVEAAGVVGLTTCVASFFYLGRERLGDEGGWSGLLGSLPSGMKALPTLLGTMLLILFPRSSVARLVLSNSAMTYVGRVSYTMYLVHWPVRVFLGFVANTIPFAHGWLDHWSLMVLLTVVVGMAQYFVVEKRLRIRDSVPSKYWMSMGLVVVGALGTVLYTLFMNGALGVLNLIPKTSTSSSDLLMQEPEQIGSHSPLYELIYEPKWKDGHKVYFPRAMVNVSRMALERWPNGQLTEKFPPARWRNASIASREVADWRTVIEHIERAAPLPLKRQLTPNEGMTMAVAWDLVRTYGVRHFWWCEKKGGKASEVALGGMYPCVLGDPSKVPSALIIGDSEVGSLMPVLSFVGKDLGTSIWSINNVACWLEFKKRWADMTPERYNPSGSIEKQACQLAGFAARKAIDALPAGSVVLLSFKTILWPKYMASNPKSMVFKEEADYIKSRGLRAVFIGILPQKKVGKCLPSLAPPKEDCIENAGTDCYEDYVNSRWYVENVLGLPFVDLADVFRVRPGSNENLFKWSVDGVSLMQDDRHVSMAGALYAVNFFADLYREYEIGRHPITPQ
ncbi:O-acetyltransferase OatA [Porphyridium purpureum]|uniref:O-acetyltransferase OatA n=1 Tax=Porphyridium purpureum TaxID=35688 RepID=A0A5J4Z7H2_PORPP|nr:O-acetyltransferase OatA [Porphyridium purpureum]|eukprot:POR6482..scf295_1